MNVPDTPWAAALAAVALLVLPAILLAWALRRSGTPGGGVSAAIAAGIFVGLIAGPGVLGRARPDLFNPLFLGGVKESRALAALVSRQGADLAALTAIDVSPVATEELREQHARERKPLEDALHAARSERRAMLDLLLAGAAAFHLLAVGGLLAPARDALAKRAAASIIETRGAPLLVGLLSAFAGAAVPALIGALFMPWREAAMVGLTLSIPATAISLGAPLMVACAVGAVVCGVGALILGWTPAATIVVVGLVGGLMWPLALGWRLTRSLRRRGATVAMTIALPAVSALMASRLDLLGLAAQPGAAPALWFCVIASVLWSSDGRLGAMWLACRVGGWPDARRRAWSVATRASNAGAGVSQLLLAAAMVAAVPQPGPLIAGSLAGALLVEMSRTPRAWLARVLEAEER